MAEKIIRVDSEQYTIYDFNIGDITLSVTNLNCSKSTNGHSHKWKEVYYIVEGIGLLEVGGVTRLVTKGDFAEVGESEFHKVTNRGSGKLIFVCAWKNMRGE